VRRCDGFAGRLRSVRQHSRRRQAAGGGGGPIYSAEATADCLRQSDIVSDVSAASDDVDIIADNAPGGGIRAEVGDQDIEVQLAFGRTRNDADTLEESYDLFDVSVARMSNAVIAWTFDPNDEERAAVEDCLS
jgi:hypothetical protein